MRMYVDAAATPFFLVHFVLLVGLAGGEILAKNGTYYRVSRVDALGLVTPVYTRV